MSTFNPWMTSSDLIESVKRKIALPINQRTFSEQDVLAFANEEMFISQVPDILLYHQEYFVASIELPLMPNQRRFPIPERAIGGKLRDVWYKDSNNNLFEMVRVQANDQAYFQRESATTNLFQKYFLEGNDIVLAPMNVSSPTGVLYLTYFLRPNQLVTNDRAAICQNFGKNIDIDNTTLLAGDTITINGLVFTAVSGSPSALEFQIGANSIDTASNIVTAILTDATYTASNGSPASTSVIVNYTTLDIDFETSNSSAFSISTNILMVFQDNIPDNITDTVKIDFLQTRPGHRTYSLSIQLVSGSVSTNSISFAAGVIPSTFVIGDYICQENECIIPQIPTDLHNGLAERVCARILAAQGDIQGYQVSESKINQIQKSEGTLMDNRVEGSTQKVTQRKGLLSFMRMGIRRRI